MNKYNLVWGDSVCVRQAFVDNTTCLPISVGFSDLEMMNYTPFAGDPELIEETAKVIKRQTGLAYKYIFLTNGASGGCTIALRAVAQSGRVAVGLSNPAPFFPLYPDMFRAAGLKHITAQSEFNQYYGWKKVFLLDTPANPTGHHVGVPYWALQDTVVIWDSVYHNNVYSALSVIPPHHDIVVGSYSKLTGLNGIRLGWIATNDDHYAEIIGRLIAPEYCGLSQPSIALLKKLLGQFGSDPTFWWNEFEKAARYNLDLNREIWSELERFFGGVPVPVNGMFYYGPMDASCKRLFEKAGVIWLPGSKCGDFDSYGRFNIGQDPKLIQKAMKAVLKADRI